MPEHYTKHTEAVTRWCPHCNRDTLHRVSAGRIGHCLEHDAPTLTKKQAKRRREQLRDHQNPKLF